MKNQVNCTGLRTFAKCVFKIETHSQVLSVRNFTNFSQFVLIIL